MALTSEHCPEISLSLLLERDSPRDQLVVTIFLLTVFGLLLGAGVKARMLKAGLDTSLAWDTGRRWWEVRTPQPIFLQSCMVDGVFTGLGSSAAT